MEGKILIIGHARHGKDTVAEILQDLCGLRFESSSQAAARIFLFDSLRDKYGYQNADECFKDRVNHRKEWHDLISAYNRPDRARLAKDILCSSDVYVGMRSGAEIDACLKQGIFKLIIGVYHPGRPFESAQSFNIDLWKYADVVVPNAGSIEDLKNKVAQLAANYKLI